MTAYNRTTSALNIDYAAQIKDRLTMYDIVYTYLQTSIKRGYVSCPFHTEKTASLYVWEDHYKCFGCGKHGDIIKFVQDYFELNFPDALSKLNTDFNLNLPIGSKPTLRQICEAKKLQAKRDELKRKQKASGILYQRTINEFVRLNQNYWKYKPDKPCAELHPLFIEALNNRDRIGYILDEMCENDSSLRRFKLNNQLFYDNAQGNTT